MLNAIEHVTGRPARDFLGKTNRESGLPAELAEATRLAEARGDGEVNLNVGCPSDRVQSGRFGACLIAEPDLVADCVAAMRAAIDVPLSVKMRLGYDDDKPKYLGHKGSSPRWK